MHLPYGGTKPVIARSPFDAVYPERSRAEGFRTGFGDEAISFSDRDYFVALAMTKNRLLKHPLNTHGGTIYDNTGMGPDAVSST
jgi:hypothetical protein